MLLCRKVFVYARFKESRLQKTHALAEGGVRHSPAAGFSFANFLAHSHFCVDIVGCGRHCSWRCRTQAGPFRGIAKPTQVVVPAFRDVLRNSLCEYVLHRKPIRRLGHFGKTAVVPAVAADVLHLRFLVSRQGKRA